MMVVSRKGKEYRLAAEGIIRANGCKPLVGKVGIVIELCPPDYRRRDIDNYLKCLFDAIKHRKDSPPGTWLVDDDSQIKHVSMTMLDPIPPNGAVFLRLSERND